MATVRNLTVFPISLPNKIVVPAKSEVTCDNSDIDGPESLPTLQTLQAGGDLIFTLDPPPVEDVEEPAPSEPAPSPVDVDVAALETPTPPPAGKKG